MQKCVSGKLFCLLKKKNKRIENSVSINLLSYPYYIKKINIKKILKKEKIEKEKGNQHVGGER